jgi:transcription-repair coupling factor (superfamily II helicase)
MVYMRNLLQKIPELSEASQAISKRNFPVLLSGLAGASEALVGSSLFLNGGFKGAMLVIVPGHDQVNAWLADMKQLIPERQVLVFDPAESLPFEVVAASREPAAGRLQALASLRGQGEKTVVIASVEALLPKLVPPTYWDEAAISLQVKQETDYNGLLQRLVLAGYERSENVSAPGQFAVRGDVVDVFPFYDTPVRMEFWGDEITSLRRLDPESQRSQERIAEIIIWPAREFIYDAGLAATAVDGIKNAYQERRSVLKGSKDAQLRLQRRANRLVEMAKEGTGGSLSLVQPYFYPEQSSLLDYLPPDSMVIIEEPGRFQEQCRSRTALLESDYRRFFQEGNSFTPWKEYYFDADQLLKQMVDYPLLCFSQLLTRLPMIESKSVFSFTTKEMQPFLVRPDLLVQEVKGWLQRKSAVLLLAHESKLKHLERELRDLEMAMIAADKWQEYLKDGRLHIGAGVLSRGFEIPGVLAVVTPEEMFGGKRGRGSRRRAVAADHLPDLSPGDYVVHVHHGIGHYVGICEKETVEIKKDYLEIVYAGDDRLFVPMEQVDMVQKYKGPEGFKPRLSRMGGSDWTRLKQRIKKRVQELAEDLLSLYSKRSQAAGYAFSRDTLWQQEFEEQFAYEETQDQLQAIAEVKADMERERPMERLICGDVGFGKTEVAIRAAFKAVQDGKQVAVLVPTTVLAHQHYLTFKERFSRYPVQVDMLSRFRSPSEQRKTLADLKKGIVDVIIGTHRLLSRDVVFKDLGLLVIDEEQRFGVADKERIKMLKANVYVIAMTATPIPRTLQMSLGGVRDMSLIETPPEDRLPVQTYVLEYDPALVRDAIMREIKRGGQVFYVHNRVQTISSTAYHLQGLIPEASFRIAHGQMKEDELEKVMWDFINQKFDCLVCTTIIESGLDFPNVNTLLVEDADYFGLSQLYQLRGRVGRSNRLAYAYFTFNGDQVLTEQAEKRLRALQEFTEFGSGFKLALRDLEIRGAGNVLGAEQHGHMASVGFDLYNSMLQEAVRELKGEKPPEKKAVKPLIDLQVDSFIPDSYIRNGKQKVDIYRRLTLAGSLEDVTELAEEVRDRFGTMPTPVIHLFDLAAIRARAGELKIREVRHSGSALIIQADEDAAPTGKELEQWSSVFGKRLGFSTVSGLEIRVDTRGLEIRELIKMLKKALVSG